MFLSNFSVRRPVATVVSIFGLMALGLLALMQLKVNERPDVALPLLVVNIPYPGASPETVERELLNRVEKSLQSVNAVREVRSSANEGAASIQIFFEFGKNLVEGADEVRNALGAVRYKLPTEIREPVIVRIDPSAQPIMQVALSSRTQTHAEISRLAEDQIADRFRAIPGIAQVNVYGALRRELSVLLQAQKMRELNVTVTEVLQALRAQNTAAPVGKVRGVLEDQSIRLLGRLEKPEEFAQIVVRRSGTELVRLGQIAVIEDGFAEVRSLSQRNGQPNVGLSIVRSREASTVSVAADVRALVKKIEAELPEGTSIAITEDGG